MNYCNSHYLLLDLASEYRDFWRKKTVNLSLFQFISTLVSGPFCSIVTGRKLQIRPLFRSFFPHSCYGLRGQTQPISAAQKFFSHSCPFAFVLGPLALASELINYWPLGPRAWRANNNKTLDLIMSPSHGGERAFDRDSALAEKTSNGARRAQSSCYVRGTNSMKNDSAVKKYCLFFCCLPTFILVVIYDTARESWLAKNYSAKKASQCGLLVFLLLRIALFQ